MTEDLGDAFDGDVPLVEARGEGVPEGVAVDVGAAEVLGRILLYHIMPRGAVPAHQKAFLAELMAVLVQIGLDFLLEPGIDRDDAILPALAVDRHEAARQVDIADPQAAHLGHPQAPVGHEKNAHPMLIFRDGFGQLLDFFLR